jgi:hypothetical protein
MAGVAKSTPDVAITALVGQAIDLGAAGRDVVYGDGLVGEALRIDVSAAAQ